MTRYLPETMTRKELRRCYSRYAISVILLIALPQLFGDIILLPIRYFMPDLLQDSLWRVLILCIINALSGFLPGALAIMLLLRRLPRAEKIPVDRLSLWELLQALVFCLGAGYLFGYISQGLIEVLEFASGLSSYDRVTEIEQVLPLWASIVFTALLPPLMEELLFRKILFNRLRALGDTSAVLLSALAFSLFHTNLYQALYAFVVGMIFGVIVLLTGSIRDTILLHMCINGSSVMMAQTDSPLAGNVFQLFVAVCILLSLVMFFRNRKNYHMEPGPLHFSARDKRRACLGSIWFWLMLIFGIGVSAVIIFL